MRFRRAGGDDSTIHARMIERAIIAADIMPAAAHLCASQLSSFHPTVAFGNTQVFTMPYGRIREEDGSERYAIGSLDLTDANHLSTLFTTGADQIKGVNNTAESSIRLPEHSLDLVIMNPPFTRPTNHALSEVPVPSFAGFDTSSQEQVAMSSRLKLLRRRLSSPMGDGNAGLATYFMDLAHAKVKEGGLIAFVIPKTLVSGASWAGVRRVLRQHYTNIVIVSIASANAKNLSFSADTNLAEVLLVAERTTPARNYAGVVLYLNLHEQPQTILEAIVIARSCCSLNPERPSGRLKIGDTVAASYVRAGIDDGGCAAVRHVGLARVFRKLTEGQLSLPRAAADFQIPISRLGDLGERGKVHRDIYGSREKMAPFRGPFTLGPVEPAASYPILWSHDVRRERSMMVVPDHSGLVRPGCHEHARSVWATATRLHLRTGLRLNSECVAACRNSQPALGGAAWPNFACCEESWEGILALWFNSTLGLMSYWWHGSRQQLGRTVLTITTLPMLTCVDPRQLAPAQIERAQEVFQALKSESFLPANEAYRDARHQALDRALLVDVLGLDPGIEPLLDYVRMQWCSEPTVHGGKKTAPK